MKGGDEMKHLMKQFADSKRMPIFEIEDNDSEYHIFYVVATVDGLEAGSASNIGFLRLDKEALSIPWDDCLSLDEHLQELYGKCINYIESEK